MESVFSNAEMLEQILLRVDMRTLLVSATRACRHWADLINSSPSLQRKLFMLPCDAAFVRLLLSCDDSVQGYKHSHIDKVQNPVLGALLPCLFSARTAPSTIDNSCLSNVYVDARDMSVNSTISTIPIHNSGGPPFGTYIDWLALDHIKNAAAWKRPDASWREMLVQQAPIKKLLIVSDVSSRTQASWSCSVVHRPDLSERNSQQTNMSHEFHLKMNELYDQLDHLVNIRAKPSHIPGQHFLASWWVPHYPRFRARTLALLKDVCLYRMDHRRLTNSSFEVSLSKRTWPSRRFDEHFAWINGNLIFSEEDGADLILHVYSYIG